MNNELSPAITRTCSKGHGKIANNNSFTDLAEITGHGRNNIQVAKFIIIKQHATGTDHGKQRNGMNLLKA